VEDEITIVHAVVNIHILSVHRYLTFEVAGLILTFPMGYCILVVLLAKSFEFLRIDFKEALTDPSPLNVTTKLMAILSHKS
jgi:hypothetical protein